MKAQEAHDQAVEKLANEYRAKGYNVQKEVILPFAVAGKQKYRADLVAERGEERHVIEVKLLGVRGEEARRWGELAREIRSHPGWHFRIMAVEREPPPIPDLERIAAEIANAEALLEQGTVTAALLLAGSAFKASANRRLEAMRALPDSDATPQALVEQLVSEGQLDQEDFVPIRDALEAGDAVAHGYFDPPASREAAERLVTGARRLLTAA